jgi:hypothetical protein
MEYLMTYGWAILIISVVLGTLYQIGVFNSSSLSVRVPPGACQVLRTSAAVNLVGQCSGILPKYVAQFDGVSSYVALGKITQEVGTNSMSFAVWFRTISLTTAYPIVFGDSGQSPRNGYDLFVGGPGSGIVGKVVIERFPNCVTYCAAGATSANPTSLGNWYFAIGTWDGSTLKLYLNGTFVSSGTAVTNSIIPNSNMYIGAQGPGGGFGNYQISNLQIYNTTLDASSIATLYQEGIGGAPVNPQYLIGWWPLNGDTKDYSGNNNNGAQIAITFVSQYGK